MIGADECTNGALGVQECSKVLIERFKARQRFQTPRGARNGFLETVSLLLQQDLQNKCLKSENIVEALERGTDVSVCC